MPKCQCCEGELPCDLQAGTSGDCCGSPQPKKQAPPENGAEKRPEQLQPTAPDHGVKT